MEYRNYPDLQQLYFNHYSSERRNLQFALTKISAKADTAQFSRVCKALKWNIRYLIDAYTALTTTGRQL